MSLTKTLCILSLAGAGTAAMASDKPLDLGDLKMTYASQPFASSELAVNYAEPQAAAAAGAAIMIFNRPRVGIRVGGGPWDGFMLNAGADVTFNVPFLPIPALRVDGEAWAQAKSLSGDQHGDALSILGIQTFMLGYAGIGPSYYFSDDNGNHHSGFGAKLLVGVNIPASGLFAEAGLLVGPSPTPIFFTIGERF